MPGGKRAGVTIKGEQEGDLCGNGAVLHLDCSGGFPNAHP